MSIREYVFMFADDGNVTRIPHAKWSRVREGEQSLEEYTNKSIHIAYAYIEVIDRKPDYCPRIDGAIYYFDNRGKVMVDQRYYGDLLQDNDEEAGGVISLQHRKKKKEVAEKYYWKLKPKQIQQVINCIW